MTKAERKAAERRTPTVPRVLQAVTTESKPKQSHATGMSEESIDMLHGMQRVHLRTGNFPQASITFWSGIQQHLKLAISDPLSTPLDRLRLPERTLWALDGIGVKTVGDTLLVTEERLLRLPTIGPVAVEELRATVAGYIQEQSLRLVVEKKKEPVDELEGVAN